MATSTTKLVDSPKLLRELHEALSLRSRPWCHGLPHPIKKKRIEGSPKHVDRKYNVHTLLLMSSGTPHFSWDSSKDIENEKKHGVDFSEARSVFYDENAKLIDDPDDNESEERFIIIGMSIKFRVLLVCHCYRSNDDEIRIISARKAVKHEGYQYKNKG